MCNRCKCQLCNKIDMCSNYKGATDENYCKFCRGEKPINICINLDTDTFKDVNKNKKLK